MKLRWRGILVLVMACAVGLAGQVKPGAEKAKASADSMVLSEVETLKGKNLDLKILTARQEQELLQVRFQQMQQRFQLLEKEIELLDADIKQHEKDVLAAHKAPKGSRVDTSTGRIVPPPPEAKPTEKPPESK